MTSDDTDNNKVKPIEKGADQNPPYEGDLQGDPTYNELIINYQNAQWQVCDKLLAVLLERYPQDQRLLDFKRDFDLQTEFRKNEKKFEKQKSKETIIRGSKLVMFSLILGLALVTLIILGIWYGYNMLVQQQENYKASQIELFSTQVSALLQSGQPEKAQEIVNQMQQVDASNPTTIQLATETTELIVINGIYNSARARYQNGEYEEALKLFQSIENQYSNYRDVEHMIIATQNQIKIKAALKDAQIAYDESRWEDAINGFEKIQSLSFDGLDANLKEKLLNSYLRRIIQMLESNNTTIDDITKAESYYRRAIAMIPQSKIYQSERENLQKISSDLLELKYTQTAEAMISDPNQTLATVNQAAGYLKKASNLNPKNSLLANEVTKITQYQTGLQYYLAMEWEPAIEQLTALIAIDENYADGLAKQLLYEAHVGRGKNYFRVGLYLDARKEFEAAENLVWNTNNLMDLFTVEIDLAETLGKLQAYQDAASYYKYAVEAVDYGNRAVAYPSFVSNLISAVQLYADGNYRDSFNLFQTTLKDKSFLFTEKEVNLRDGVCLAFVAKQYQSSVQAILERNGLTSQTIATSEESFFIPMMVK